MDHLVEYVKAYGLAVLIIAVIIIAFIGFLKICGVFKKLNNKTVKKVIYYSLDVALSFGVGAVYFSIFDKNFDQYIAYSLAQIAVTTTLYAIYENFGIRALIQKLVSLIRTAIQNNKNAQFVRLVQQMGIDHVLQEIQTLVAQTEAAQETKSDEQTR
jgi:hypothetical protein